MCAPRPRDAVYAPGAYLTLGTPEYPRAMLTLVCYHAPGAYLTRPTRLGVSSPVGAPRAQLAGRRSSGSARRAARLRRMGQNCQPDLVVACLERFVATGIGWPAGGP